MHNLKLSIITGLIVYVIFHPSTVKLTHSLLKYPVKHSLLVNSLLVMVGVFGYFKISDIMLEHFSQIGMKSDLIGTLEDSKSIPETLPEGTVEHKIF